MANEVLEVDWAGIILSHIGPVCVLNIPLHFRESGPCRISVGFEQLRASHVRRNLQILWGFTPDKAHALSGNPTEKLILQLTIQNFPGGLRFSFGSEVGRAVVDQNCKRDFVSAR